MKPDVTQPNAARMYDYFLGGSHNFGMDRDAAQQVLARFPETVAVARANRSFLRRVVRHLAEAGIDQFLDLGSGIPTVGNVHDIAQKANPEARVVYVDNETIAVTYSTTLLAGNPGATAIQADLCEPERLLSDPRLRGALDLDRPVAVLLVSVLHFVPDSADPNGIVAAYREALAPGSFLAISHGTHDNLEGARLAAAEQARRVYDDGTIPLTARTTEQITGLFGDFPLVEPGVVPVNRWHPDSEADDGPAIPVLAGLARHPANP